MTAVQVEDEVAESSADWVCKATPQYDDQKLSTSWISGLYKIIELNDHTVNINIWILM